MAPTASTVTTSDREIVLSRVFDAPRGPHHCAMRSASV